MPALYSFSMDYQKHLELIQMVESTKNKSDLIRSALTEYSRRHAHREYEMKLERIIRTMAKELEWKVPDFLDIKKLCYLNNPAVNSEEE